MESAGPLQLPLYYPWHVESHAYGIQRFNEHLLPEGASKLVATLRTVKRLLLEGARKSVGTSSTQFIDSLIDVFFLNVSSFPRLVLTQSMCTIARLTTIFFPQNSVNAVLSCSVNSNCSNEFIG